MKYSSTLSLTIPAAIMCSCSGIMPGVGILAPVSVSGYRMDFSDLEGTHEFLFSADGTYSEQCTPADTSKVTKKTGKWKWTRKSPSSATLILDGVRTVNLNFTTGDHANGSFTDDAKRLYAFEFTKI